MRGSRDRRRSRDRRSSKHGRDPKDGRESWEPSSDGSGSVRDGTPDGVRVRPMTEADLDRVTEIEIRSFSVPWNRRTFRSLLDRKDAELWVVEGEEELSSEEGVAGTSVIAYLVLWFAADEAELADVAVAEEHRGRGLGALLVDRAIERARARDAGSLFLEVRASNDKALALYRSRGFHVISVRRGYYSKPPEDALVMLRSLW